MIKPYNFTVDDFAVMVQAGLFHDQRVELLDGVIVDMSPASPGHEYAIDVIAENLMRAFLDRARVRVQNAVNLELPEWLPHTDVVLVARKDYSEQRPTPEDIFLLVEVANTSLALDKGQKRTLYAQAGIKEYWIADLNSRTWLVNRDPEGQVYRAVEEVPFGREVALLEFPNEAHVWL
ncbi:Uma2 family endonuclease [soil metagenome]